jgi:hypothetical protein
MQANALTIIHKYIRAELFAVTQLLAQAGPDSVDPVRRAIAEVAELLRGHADQEDARLEPLLAQSFPTLAARLTSDHRRLEEQLEQFCKAANASEVDLLQLYLDWNRVVAAYLVHLDAEERTWFPLLADPLPPVEYLAQTASGQSPAAARAFFEKLWSTITPLDRARIERALRKQDTEGTASTATAAP